MGLVFTCKPYTNLKKTYTIHTFFRIAVKKKPPSLWAERLGKWCCLLFLLSIQTVLASILNFHP